MTKQLIYDIIVFAVKGSGYMNKLDPKEIVRNAIDGLTYSKAYDLYLSKKVKQL